MYKIGQISRAGMAIAAIVTLGMSTLSGVSAASPARPLFAINLLSGASAHNTYDGRCLDEDIGSATHDGTNVQVWSCNGWTNQDWYVYSDATIRSGYDGRCLDEDIGNLPTHDGTNVQVWSCNGWDNQDWH